MSINEVRWLSECGSTNAYAKEHFEEFGPVGAGRATFLACCRQGVCFIPLILTPPHIWGLSGIELCQPIADGLTFCISVPFLLPFLKELKEQGDEE